MKRRYICLVFVLNLSVGPVLAFDKSKQAPVSKQEIHKMGKCLEGRENSSNKTRAIFSLGCYLEYSKNRNKNSARVPHGKRDSRLFTY